MSTTKLELSYFIYWMVI